MTLRAAGETEAAIQPRLGFLRSNGISPILNYAVEDDVGKSGQHCETPCDANLSRFLKSIEDCNVLHARGFMAIKVLPCMHHPVSCPLGSFVSVLPQCCMLYAYCWAVLRR